MRLETTPLAWRESPGALLPTRSGMRPFRGGIEEGGQAALSTDWGPAKPRRLAETRPVSKQGVNGRAIASCIVNEPFRDQKANTRGWSTAVCVVERGS
jgi:hypothetical protein